MTDDNSPDNSLGRPASHLWFPNRPAVAALRTEWERRQRENGNNCADWPVWLQPFVERLLAALEAPPEDMAAFDRAEFDELLREVVALREWKAAHEAAAFGAPTPEPTEAAIDAVCDLALTQARDMIAQDRLTPDLPEYREVIRARLRVAYLIDSGAALESPPERRDIAALRDFVRWAGKHGAIVVGHHDGGSTLGLLVEDYIRVRGEAGTAKEDKC